MLVIPSQLHVGIAKCEPTSCSGIEIEPCDTTAVTLAIAIQPIEIGVMTVVEPPASLICCSTVTTIPIIISVMSGELHAIKVVTSNHAVPYYPYPPVLVPSNSEFVVGACSAHMKVVIAGILGMACKVIKVDS